jgi:ligand-binding sensor domain-containing protein/two-component sensor histidine kinase
MRSLWATLLFSCFLITGLRAQQYNFKTWSLESGLPQSEVTSLEQGKRGFLWVGTLGGLASFDGIKFKTYTKKEGLGSNKVSCIFLGKGDFVWVGSFTNGVAHYTGSGFKNYGEKEGLPPGGVYSITQTPDGKIWVATAKGLAYLENDRFVMLPASSGVPKTRFWKILSDRKGVLWLATLGEGLYRYDGHQTSNYRLEHGLSNKIIYSLFESRRGDLWIGTYGGITKFDGKKFTAFYPGKDLNVNRAMSISEDREGLLWIALDGGGLLSFNGKTFKRFTNSNGLATNYIHSLKHDREGNLWIGTVGSGLQRFTPSCFTFYTRQEGLRNENIRALSRDSHGNLWAGTFDGGAGMFNGSSFKWFTQENGLPSNIVNFICNDKKGQVWLGTNRGISCYNGKGFKNYDYDNGLLFNIVNYLLPDSADHLWIATNEGLSIFDGKKFRNYTNPGKPGSNNILCLFKDAENRMWLGTKAGVFQFANGRFIQDKKLSAMNMREVNAITQDYKGNIWFGTYDHGVIRYSPQTGTFQHLSGKQSLLSEAVTSLRIDSLNQLWIGGIRGLNRLDLAAFYKNPETPLSAYSYADGFRGVEVNPNALAEGRNGHMWIGTVNGLVHYNPQEDQSNGFVPMLTLLSIKLYSKTVNWKERGMTVKDGKVLPENLTLKTDENHLTFDYRGIYLTNPELVTYQVKLDGFDKKWSPPSTGSSAIYSNLPPGNYTFNVMACTQHGNCTKKPVTYSFYIEPPFWSKDRVIGVSILLLSAIVFGFVRWRESNFKKLNSLLEEKVKQRTALLEQKNQEKEVLLKEVHHRVKNNLQIITSLLNLQGRHITDPAALGVLREIKDRIKSISMLHQRLYQREELSCIDLSDYVQTLCKSLFASYGVREDHVRLEFDIPSLQLDIDTALTLGLIVNELVSNTLKYAFPDQRKGTLLIQLTRTTETDYILTISDDGTGLPKNFEEKMTTSFGLQLVSSLIKKLHGSLKFYSQGGTQIRVQFVILPA